MFKKHKDKAYFASHRKVCLDNMRRLFLYDLEMVLQMATK